MERSLLPLLLQLLSVWVSGTHAQLVPRGPGETLAVQCEYPKEFENHGKIWCRAASENQCTAIVKTTQNSSSGRTRIQDNKEIRVISITVEELTTSDTGAYWCGVDVSNKVEIMKKIELKVSDGLIAQAILRGPGESMTVLYEYYKELDGLEKIWCKETNWGTCDLIVTTTQGNSTLLTAASARTRIQDNQQTRLISITVEKLAETDTGVYWCRVHYLKRDLFIKRIELQVSEGVRAEVIPGTIGDKVTVQCAYPTGYESYFKTWCRETIGSNCNPIVTTTSSSPVTASSGWTTILDNNQTRVISVSIGKVSVEDAGFYWCGVHLSDRVRIEKRFEIKLSNDFRTPNVTSVAGNCTTTYTSSSVCWSDWKLVTLVTVVLLNKVLAAGGIYAIISRQNGAAV